MKKFFLFAAACVALVACKNDNSLNNIPQGTPFKAGQYVTISAGMPTNGNQSAIRKISGTGGATEISYVWEENDQILVKVGADTAHFSLVDGAGTNSGIFAGKMPGSGSTFDIQYPIDAPDLSVQAYKENGLPAGMMSFGATGCSIDAASELTATTSALKLNLTGSEEISKIVINMVDADDTEYTLTTAGVTLSSTATPFYLVVNPVTSKVRVTVYATSTVPIDCFTSASIEFVANQCADTQDKEAKVADYICFTALANSTVSFGQYWAMYAEFKYVKLQWKKNNGDWENLAFSYSSPVPSMELNEGDKLYVRSCESNSWLGSETMNMFSISGNVKLSGNIMALLNINPGSASMFKDCFRYLFGESDITDASELILPSTNLTNGCYSNMFRGCSSLVKTPELPATQLANECYKCMFKGCTSLVNAPVLPATTLTEECYHSMFDGCTSLVNAPELPVTTLEKNCYGYMFKGCSNLVKAPELPATTLANYCYSHMFENCSNLETAPVLSAATLVYNCYNAMFYNCSKLSSVTMLATSVGKNEDVCLVAWLYNTASSGTIYAANAAAITAINNLDYSKYSGGGPVPTGWTVTVKP